MWKGIISGPGMNKNFSSKKALIEELEVMAKTADAYGIPVDVKIKFFSDPVH